MTSPKKKKSFFAEFPPLLKWTSMGILIFLIAYLVIYKVYQHHLNEKKRISVLVADKKTNNPDSNVAPSVDSTTDTSAPAAPSEPSEPSEPETPTPNQKKKAPKDKTDLKPLIHATTLSFAYTALSQKVLFGVSYRSELEFFKSVLENVSLKLQMEYLEKYAATGVRTFQELELDLMLLSKKSKRPKKVLLEPTTDQEKSWTGRVKKYLMSLVHVEKSDDPQRELILLRISDVFLMLQNKDLKGAISIMSDMNQNKLMECTAWIKGAKALEEVLYELNFLYDQTIKNLINIQTKINEGRL